MPGAVDHPVDTTVPLKSLADEGFQVCLLRDRARETESPEILRQILGLARRRHERHRVTPARELSGAGGTHAAAGCRHYHHLLPDPLGSIAGHAPTPSSLVVPSSIPFSRGGFVSSS